MIGGGGARGVFMRVSRSSHTPVSFFPLGERHEWSSLRIRSFNNLFRSMVKEYAILNRASTAVGALAVS